jgi:glucose/arabinose dehydrogenase
MQHHIIISVKKYINHYHAIFICAVILLTACNSKPIKENHKISLLKITGSLTSPVNMAVSGHDNTLYIAEQSGKIRLVKGGRLLAKPFLDITSKLATLNASYSEMGLLGMAFHPNFKSNGYFFIYYSAPSNQGSHQSVVARYHATPGSAVADTLSETVITINQPESNHNGGQLAFGPDGLLYIGVGDGGGAGDQHGSMGNGQDLSSLLGKILRIDVDTLPYKIPEGAVFTHNNQRAEIFAYGLRNPWRFSFDAKTGALFCGDVGQNKFEEINIIENGKNYGWRGFEGFEVYDNALAINEAAPPIYTYPHDVGNSVTGGFVYYGKQIPWLKGAYMYADWSGKLFYLTHQNNWQNHNLSVTNMPAFGNINAFGSDNEGELYILVQQLTGPFDITGSLYKIIP